MTTVLVTGGAGFIATHTDIELLRKLKENRARDTAEVRSTQASAATGGGLFSRLRETFTGR